MSSKVLSNPKCKKCIYRSSKPGRYSCDYNYLTGKMRGCSVEDCTRFVEGPRLSIKEEKQIVIEPANDETDDYFFIQKARVSYESLRMSLNK